MVKLIVTLWRKGHFEDPLVRVISPQGPTIKAVEL